MKRLIKTLTRVVICYLTLLPIAVIITVGVWVSIPLKNTPIQPIQNSGSPWIQVGHCSKMLISEDYFILTEWEGDILIAGRHVWGKIYAKN